MSDNTSNNNHLKQQRPLSPHISAYGWQITSLMSIVHRVTGVVLFSGLVLVVAWLVLLSEMVTSTSTLSLNCYSCFLDLFINSTLAQLAISGYIFCLFFNLGCNIRHLFWEMGLGFEMQNVYRSAWLIIYLSVIFTGVTMFIIKVSSLG